MTTDRSLATLLRSFQTPPDRDVSSLLPPSTTLLSRLTNPLNVTLLASQLLSAPAIWDRPNTLQTCIRVLSVFNTAAINIIQQESATPDFRHAFPFRTGLERDPWVKAVVKGADEKSPRWRHMLLIGGLLLGFEGGDRHGLPNYLRAKLESALVKATNFALTETGPDEKLGEYCIALVLNHTFELLSNAERSRLNYDLLLPVLMEVTYQSEEGLEAGYFLGLIDRDIVQGPENKFSWSIKSETFEHIKHISSKPLISALGPLSRLIAHSLENVNDTRLVSSALDHIASFSRTLSIQWRQNKLSEVDSSEESLFLSTETLTSTLPVLWRLLRSILFSSVILLRSILARTINDPFLAHPTKAPYISMQTLHTLRSLSFISSRHSQTHQSSSQYVFANLTAIDILTQHPERATNFLTSIRPTTPGDIPTHPHDRTLDHFFLNTAEHFPLILSPTVNEDVLVAAALPYLTPSTSPTLIPIFEAAHSVILAVLSSPQPASSATSTHNHISFYLSALFAAFPTSLSQRQFRLAFKTLIQITTSPRATLSHSQPLLPSILLDLLYTRALTAPTTPLPPQLSTPDPAAPILPTPLSEQAVLTLTLIDSLPTLPVTPDLETWLPLTADLMNKIDEPAMRAACIERFWECLSSGEMDVERAGFCVDWWGTRGGREAVLFGRGPEGVEREGLGHGQESLMSGALEGGSKL